MKVLYDHQIFQAQRFGGISRYFYELITRMARVPAMEVSVFQGLSINQYGLESFRSEYQSFFGMQRPEIPKTNRIFTVLNRLLLRGFVYQNGADVYHLTYYADPCPGFVGARVLTVYDMIHEIFPEQFVGDPTARLKRAAVEKADQIIAISDATKQDLVRIYDVAAEKIQVIHLANSLSLEPSAVSPVQAPYILFVGNRDGYKNFEPALRAFGKSFRLKADFQLICFGGQPFNTSEKTQIQELGLEGRVFHMRGPDTLLANLYNHAIFFVCPSLYEGFGLPVLEAMHYGCPVLCSQVSSLPEVVGDAASFFDPGSVESMMAAMEALAYGDQRRAELASQGILRESRFSWDRCAQETAKVYRST